MSRRSSIWLDMQNWEKRRYFAQEFANGCNEPSAAKGQRCDICDGEIVGGICETCGSVFVRGKRVPGKTQRSLEDDRKL